MGNLEANLSHLALACGFTPVAVLVLAPAGRTPDDMLAAGCVTVAVPVTRHNVADAAADPAIGQYLEAGAVVVLACRTSAVAKKLRRLLALNTTTPKPTHAAPAAIQ